MATWSHFFLLVSAVAVVSAGSIREPDTGLEMVPRCSTECSMTQYTLLRYMVGMTYYYRYTGSSRISLSDVPEGTSPASWEAEVGFTWLSPCDVAITFRNVTVDGRNDAPDAKNLERYPMMMAVTDAHVRHVCTHPDDEAWSINWKKGVASILQVSLPTRSAVSSGLEFIEEDVVGKCPTKYEVQKVENAITIRKEKSHHRCKHRYPTPFETASPWLKLPVPLRESKSVCTQELINGVFREIVCEDMNIIRPSFGAYKYIEAHQNSRLQYKSQIPGAPETVLHFNGPMVKKSLLLDYSPPKKDASLVPQLDEALKEICEKTRTNIEEDSAVLMAKVLHILRRIPGNSIKATLRKITGGEICSNYQRLESLFLDAIAFVHEPSAVGIIVKELVNGRAAGGRAALYTVALHLTPRPDIHTIEALKPLFETPKTLGLEKLAAASMVYSYCKHNTHCEEETSVRQISETVAAQVQQYCVASGDEESDQMALAALKALGNMGVMTPEAAMSVIECIRNDGAQNNIRVAAAHSFRNAKCQRQVTQHLLTITTDQATDTEVRIASYLAALRCAEREDLKETISKIAQEENTQVRSFILSHLLNLQESSDPYKERLRYLLSDFILPVNFTADFRKYSRNYHMSYHSQPLGLGAGYESDVIFTPGSYLPRSINMNLTTTLGSIPVNMGEFGARLEGLEPVIEQLLGPNGYFQKTSMSKFMHGFINFVQNADTGLFPEGIGQQREERSIDISSVSDFLKKIYKKEKGGRQKADAYVRFDGQEMLYGSWAGDLEGTDMKQLFESFINYFTESLDQLSEINLNTARAAQMKFQYSLASIQGIPLKLELEGTAVLGFKIDSEVGYNSLNKATILQVLPSFSMQVNGFVGFDSHLIRNGLKMENLISSDTGFFVRIKVKDRSELQLNFILQGPMKILNIKSEMYLMKVMAGHGESKIVPPSVRDVRIKKSSCIVDMEPIIGLRLCYDFDVPNVFRSTGLPLGGPSVFKLFGKRNFSLREFSLKTSVHHDGGTKLVKVEAEAPGSPNPRKLLSTIMYERTPESVRVSASVESPSAHGHIWVHLMQQDQYRALEVLGKWNSNGIQTFGGFMVELSTHWNSLEKEIVMRVFATNVFILSPGELIMKATYRETSNGEQTKLDFSAHTLGFLRRFMLLNVEAGVDLKYNRESRVLVLERLRKLDMKCTIGSTTFLASVQRESDSRYASLVKLSQKQMELVGVSAKHEIIHSEGREVETKTSAEGWIKDASYKLALNVAWRSLKKGVTLLIVRKMDNLKIVDIDIMHLKGPEMSSAKLLVDIPEYMKVIKMESKFVKQEDDKYMLEVAFVHGRQTILHITGPVTMVFSVHSSSKFEADLRITPLASSPLTVSSSLELSSKKNVLKVMTKYQEDVLFSYDWAIQVDRSQRWTIRMDVRVPLLTNCEVGLIIKKTALHVSMNTLMFPKISPSRRIKALADVNLETREIRTDVAWDADRDPSKKLTANLRVTQNLADTDHFGLSGNVIYKSKNYRLLLEASGFNQSPWKRDARCQITMPTGETLTFDMNVAVQRRELSTELHGQVTYKDFNNHHYQFSEKLEWQRYHSQAGFMVVSQSRYESPTNQVTTLDMKTVYSNTVSERLFVIQAKLSSPSLLAPLDVELKLDNKQGNYKTYLVAHSDAPLNILDYEVALKLHRGIERVIVHLDMTAALMLLETIHRLASPRLETLYTSSPLPQAYRFHYSRQSPQKHSVIFKFPSRTVEGEVEYSPADYSLRFYPNKERSESKYEIAASISRDGEMPLVEITGVHARVRHPSLKRDLKVSLQSRRESHGIKGTIDIDIFQNEEDKITGILSCHAVTPDSFWMETTLTVPALKTEPYITATAAYTQHIFSFSIQGSESLSIPSSLIVAGRIDRSQDGRAALGLSAELEHQSPFEFSGSLTHEEGPYCYGFGLHAIAHILQPDYYEITSRLCNPAFLEISVNKLRKLDVLKIRLGYLDPSTAEISFLVDDKDTLQTVPIIMAKADLVSDTLINIDLAKDSDKLSWAKNWAHEEWKRISSSITSVTSKITEKLRRHAHLLPFHFPPSELPDLLEKLRNELKEIGEDVSHDVRENPLLIYLKPYFESAWSLLLQVERDLCAVRDRIDEAFQEDFQGLFDSLMKVFVKILEMFEEGQTPKIVQWIIDFVQDIPEIRKLRELIDELIHNYPEEVESLKEMVAKIISKLEEDTDDVRDAISHSPALQREINWFFRNYNRILGLQMNKFITQVLQYLLRVSVQYDEHHLTISVPTKRPITSLTQALQYALPQPRTLLSDIAWLFYSFDPNPLKYLIWNTHEFFPRKISNLLPPYNRTALIVVGKELLTFDGAVLRAPPSPCKVLLLAFKSNSLFMEHPHPGAQQQLTLKTPEAVVIITPNHHVSVNGHEMTGATVTRSGINVSKVSGRMTVSVPSMTLEIYTKHNIVSVIVSGWAFGETAGLLGSYDGEVANDWLMSSGSLAPNLQELVRSWQEDQHCLTPSISPVKPAGVLELKYFQCHVALSVCNKCCAIINPDPFIKICYATAKPSDAQMAYQAMCASKDVTHVFPSI